MPKPLINNINSLISLIGNYQLDSLVGDEKKAAEAAQAILDTNKTVENALLAGCVDKDKVSTEARKKFVTALVETLNNGKNLQEAKAVGSDPEQYAISMEKLLGQDVLNLYKAAIAEERSDPNFRKAVFARALKQYDVPTPKERLILWVAGPSASGKTFAAREAFKKACAILNPTASTEVKKGHNAVFIDGGIEREESQMRQLVLQVALAKGYPGIKDLHNNTKLRIKTHIKKAALKANNISLVIPNTFSNPLAKFKIRKYAKLPNAKQVFSQVVGKEEDLFKRTVARMGVSRAYRSDSAKPDTDINKIKINNRNIGVESKVYQREYFDAGVRGSKLAKESYLRSGPDTLYLEIINDKIHVYFDKQLNKWKQCQEGGVYESADIRMVSIHEFVKWNHKSLYDTQDRLSFDQWLKHEREKNGSVPPIRVFQDGHETHPVNQASHVEALAQIDNILSLEKIKLELKDLQPKCLSPKDKKRVAKLMSLVDENRGKGDKAKVDLRHIRKEIKHIKQSISESESTKEEKLQAKATVPKPDEVAMPTGGKVMPILTTTYTREMMLAAKEAMQKVLQQPAKSYTGWVLQDKIVDDKVIQISVNDDANKERFTIHPAEMRTIEDNVDNFKAMLACYKAANPDKLPRVTAYSEEGEKLWQQAINNVYADEISEKHKINIVLVSPITSLPLSAVRETTPSSTPKF